MTSVPWRERSPVRSTEESPSSSPPSTPPPYPLDAPPYGSISRLSSTTSAPSTPQRRQLKRSHTVLSGLPLSLPSSPCGKIPKMSHHRLRERSRSPLEDGRSRRVSSSAGDDSEVASSAALFHCSPAGHYQSGATSRDETACGSASATLKRSNSCPDMAKQNCHGLSKSISRVEVPRHTAVQTDTTAEPSFGSGSGIDCGVKSAMARLSRCSLRLRERRYHQQQQQQNRRCRADTEPMLDRSLLLSLLECPVCLLSAAPPLNQCTNGHIVCPDCIARLSNCPVCRQSYNTGIFRNLALEQIANSIVDGRPAHLP